MGLRLFYRDDFRGKPTVIGLYGFGSRPSTKPMERAAVVSNLLFKCGHLDVNFASFDYPSHRSSYFDGFSADHTEIARVADRLEKFGVNPSKMGIAGGCYGSYVGGRFLQEGGQAAFAVLIGPYFGKNSLQWWSKALLNFGRVPGVGVLFERAFRDSSRNRIRIDFRDLANYVAQDLDLRKSNVKTLIAGIKAHGYFKDHPNRGVPVNQTNTTLLDLPETTEPRQALVASVDFIRKACEGK